MRICDSIEGLFEEILEPRKLEEKYPIGLEKLGGDMGMQDFET